MPSFCSSFVLMNNILFLWGCISLYEAYKFIDLFSSGAVRCIFVHFALFVGQLNKICNTFRYWLDMILVMSERRKCVHIFVRFHHMLCVEIFSIYFFCPIFNSLVFYLRWMSIRYVPVVHVYAEFFYFPSSPHRWGLVEC